MLSQNLVKIINLMNYGDFEHAEFNGATNGQHDNCKQEVSNEGNSNSIVDIENVTTHRKWSSLENHSFLKYVCAKCGQEFPLESQYEHHLDTMHTDVQTARDLKMTILSSTQAECMVCGESVKHHTVRDLQQHHFSHLERKSYKCECHGYYFISKANALAHLKYRGIATQPSAASTMKVEYNHNLLLADGIEFNQSCPETGIGYTCPECGENFSSEDLWKLHCNDAHDFKSMQGLQMTRIDATVRCNQCNIIISGKCDNYKLRRHKLTHSPYKAFYCRLCKYSRKRKDDVLLHIRQSHVVRDIKYY